MHRSRAEPDARTGRLLVDFRLSAERVQKVLDGFHCALPNFIGRQAFLDAALARRVDETISLSKRHVERTATIILEHPEPGLMSASQ